MFFWAEEICWNWALALAIAVEWKTTDDNDPESRWKQNSTPQETKTPRPSSHNFAEALEDDLENLPKEDGGSQCWWRATLSSYENQLLMNLKQIQLAYDSWRILVIGCSPTSQPVIRCSWPSTAPWWIMATPGTCTAKYWWLAPNLWIGKLQIYEFSKLPSKIDHFVPLIQCEAVINHLFSSVTKLYQPWFHMISPWPLHELFTASRSRSSGVSSRTRRPSPRRSASCGNVCCRSEPETWHRATVTVGHWSNCQEADTSVVNKSYSYYSLIHIDTR